MSRIAKPKKEEYGSKKTQEPLEKFSKAEITPVNATSTKDGTLVFCRYDRLENPVNLTPNPDNFRKHPQEQVDRIAHTIESNGWRNPVVISTLSGYIVKGEGRYLASCLRGWREIPIEYQDYESEEDELSDLLADNKASSGAIDDFGKIATLREKLGNLNNHNFFKRAAFSKEDQTLLNKFIEDKDNSKIAKNVVDETRNIPEMELSPFEHYDYVMLCCDDSRDFMQICELLGIKKSKFTFENPKTGAKTQKIGIARAIKGKKFLELIEKLKSEK